MSDSDDPFIIKDKDLNSSVSYNLILHRLPPKLRLKIISPPQDPIDSVQNIYDVIKALINRRFSNFQINDLMLKTEIGQEYKRQGLNFEKDILRIRNAKSGETEIAEQFSKLNNDFRYCASWGKWLKWDENKGYWQIDEGLTIISEISKILKEMEVPGIRRSYNLVDGVEHLLRREEHILSYDKDWDSNLLLITTPNGTVDLKSGILRPSFKTDMSTKITSIAPDRKQNITLWLKFLNEATNSDQDYIKYLQRISGYCLTGMINEHALFFLYGPGGNGKGVFLNTITNIMGDYACVSDMSTFTESKYEQHSTALAFLRGARLVTSQETEGGKSWRENLIKTLTSDDPITARFMRQDFFTFQKQCKLLISGNHEPQLRNVDDAMRRRFNKLPFTFKPQIPDKFLLQKLESEHSGIFHWMIQGCLEWQKQSLNSPNIVTESTESYFEEQDSFQQFIEEECILDLNSGVSSIILFKQWCLWASRNHLRQGTNPTFKETMIKNGFKYSKHLPQENNTRGFIGLKLKSKEIKSKKIKSERSKQEIAKQALNDIFDKGTE